MGTLRSRVIEVYLGDKLRDAARLVQRARRRGRRRRLDYVHAVDDPYALALLPSLRRLVETGHFELRVWLIPSPNSAYAPDAERLRAWALADARRLAQAHGIDFPGDGRSPAPASISQAKARAQQILRALAQNPADSALAVESLRKLELLAVAVFSGGVPETSHVLNEAQLRLNEQEVHRMGHYQGSMLRYEGEWYWGLDRFGLLMQRLRAEGLELPAELVPPLRLPALAMADRPAGRELELFFSFRSPYSYLAFRRTRELARARGLDLRVRLVLPMVMRGLQVPWIKRRYLVKDARRVAGQGGVLFGRIADPLGDGVERCLAVAEHARELGKLDDWVDAASAGIWSKGLDPARDRDLRVLVADAGLEVPAAMRAIRAPEVAVRWRAEVERNREALLGMGLWGVPSFRMGDIVLWGQDRLVHLEAMLGARSE